VRRHFPALSKKILSKAESKIQPNHDGIQDAAENQYFFASILQGKNLVAGLQTLLVGNEKTLRFWAKL